MFICFIVFEYPASYDNIKQYEEKISQQSDVFSISRVISNKKKTPFKYPLPHYLSIQVWKLNTSFT